MHSSNPVLTRTSGHHSPTAATMTIDSVVMRTAALFAVLLPAAAAAFVIRPSMGVIVGAMLAAFLVAMVIIFTNTIRPPLMFLYAALEGVTIGGVSLIYADRFGGNVVPQAIVGTLCAFAVMLGLYRSGRVRATPKFRRTLLMATIGYIVFGLVHLLGVALGAWDSIYFGADGPNMLGILASLAGTTMASLFLILDFDEIERGIADRHPEQYAWTAAFGLTLTLVWLYLEVLRLVSIFSGDD